MNAQSRRLRVIVNGKAAADPLLRPAVKEIRDRGHDVEVRVTWEGGDAARYASEAVDEKVDVVVAAGGDGTINEVADGMVSGDSSCESALAVIPYGTANDFATGTGILKGDPLSALELAATGDATAIDLGEVNGRVFVNVTSGGFGAEVTANTPAELKKAIGGAAYSIMGVVTAAKMTPYECRFTTPEGETHEGKVLMMAVGNGRQCGGGYQVTSQALLNDGLLDVIVVQDAEIPQLGVVMSELMDVNNQANRFVYYRQLREFKLHCTRPLQVNLDGEPYRDTEFHFKAIPKALPCILGPDAPVILKNQA